MSYYIKYNFNNSILARSLNPCSQLRSKFKINKIELFIQDYNTNWSRDRQVHTKILKKRSFDGKKFKI